MGPCSRRCSGSTVLIRKVPFICTGMTSEGTWNESTGVWSDDSSMML